MKKIAVVAKEKKYADIIMNYISKYMGRYAEFFSYSLEEVKMRGIINENYVLLSSYHIIKQMRPKISDASEIIVLSLTLIKKQIEKLKKIPKGTKALLVIFDRRTCLRMITCIYASGFKNAEFYPYYEEGGYDPSIKVAVTPNQMELVPPGISKVINVGESTVDMYSLFVIADKLGVYDEFMANEATAVRKEYCLMNSGIGWLLNDKNNMMKKLNAVIKLMNDGIMFTDDVGRIYLCNEKAYKLMAHRSKVLLGVNIEDMLPELDVCNCCEKLIKSDHVNLIASSVEIQPGENQGGHIIILKDFEETGLKQHDIRLKKNGDGHVARYTLKDIIGNSREIKACIENVRQFAKTDGTVMITGESGTGKELFAHSIHNESLRKNERFVAVSCAAIPDSLLESEMFGYEEGSFTGAKKGGKVGYFELAHRGTIFLDEIGEMPLMLQSKLLRILEERKVTRVGANKNIDIDVRVIAATNRELYRMIDAGTFREDLYYRLNVLPAHIPPLRNRKEDILPLFYFFAHRANRELSLSPEAKEVLTGYIWPGNVRELRNVVEFVLTKGKQIVGPDDLPPLKQKQKIALQTESVDNQGICEAFIYNEWKEITLYHTILNELKNSLVGKERYGRQKLLERINKSFNYYTESEVRKALSRLSEQGFVKSSRGRGGSVITPEGVMLLHKIENK